MGKEEGREGRKEKRATYFLICSSFLAVLLLPFHHMALLYCHLFMKQRVSVSVANNSGNSQWEVAATCKFQQLREGSVRLFHSLLIYLDLYFL